jgi:hypothetical protein
MDPHCPFCTIRALKPGMNDLATRRPDLAAQFDESRNGGPTAADIPASSHHKYWWLCPHGHSYQASPTNRTANGQGCSVCLGRRIVSGVNDLATQRPSIAAEWHPGDPTRPHEVGTTSVHSGNWICRRGHIYSATVHARVTGKDCPECAAIDKAAERDLTITHPALAAEWHPTKNRDIAGPHVLTAGSQRTAYWLCAKGHHYLARVDARARTKNATGCPHCARRRLLTSFNDLATTDPILILEWDKYANPRPPEMLMSSTTPYKWRCRAAGHDYSQSVQHRRKSGGCPLCSPAFRIGRTIVLELAA